MNCPICKGSHFSSFRGRYKAQCNKCGSLERHRLMWLFLRTYLQKEMKVVHIAPESSISQAIKAVECNYTSGDIVPSKGDQKIDVRNMMLSSNSIDVFVCSHVLEHILDDFTAMQEIYRVLKPSGVAILQVPIAKGKRTFRDPSANTPEKRKRAHGQNNHVRIYGSLDYPLLLQAAGLRHDPYKATKDETKEFNLSKESELHTCYKMTQT